MIKFSDLMRLFEIIIITAVIVNYSVIASVINIVWFDDFLPGDAINL